MRRGRSRFSDFRVGVVVGAIILVACYFGFTKRNPIADRYELKLAFTETTALKKGSLVRAAGVQIGKVQRVEAAPGSSTATLVTIELDETSLPLHQDATFKARPRIFLEGNDFVDVKPGSPSKPELEDGATVPSGQTSGPVGLPEVLTLFEKDGREAFRTILDEYGKALEKGGAAGYNRSIRWWEPAYKNGAIVADATLGERRGDLRRYLASSAKVAAALDRDPAALQSLITDFAATASAIGSEQQALRDALSELPGTLRIGRQALGSLNEAFPSVRRLVRDLRPAVRSSGPALDAQLPLVRQLRGAVRSTELRGLAKDLRALVPDLVHLTEGNVELQQQSRLLGSCQVNVLGPWQRDRVPGPFPSAGRVFEEGVKWLPGIASESRNFDANGQYVRSQVNGGNFTVPLGDNRFLLSATRLKAMPSKSAQPTFHPDVPCETQERPDLRDNGQSLPSTPVDTRSAAFRERAADLAERVEEPLERLLRNAQVGDAKKAGDR